ncbi:MAG TPA: DUF3352 domain-containing protein [Candidatus Limnocylindrales bacterium]
MHRLVVALVTLIGLAGVAFIGGYLLLFSASTDRAAALAPANAAVYVNVYLQPSTGQQMNLGELIGRLPGFADDASLDEKVDQVVQNLLGQTGLDYREQIKPWLGNQIALVAWSTDGDVANPDAVVIADVKDRPAAEAAIAEIAAESGQSFVTQAYGGAELHVSDGTAYGFVGEMLVIGEAVEGVQAVVDVQGGAASLGSRADFRATMAGLPVDHLASVFVDLARLAEATETTDELSGVSTAGAALVAERDGLRLSGSAPFDVDEAAATARAGFALGSEPSSLVDWMPEETIAEVVVFGLRQTLEDAEAAIGSTPEGEELSSTLDTFRALAAFGLGIDLDDDILPLLDREVGIAITGFDGTLPSGQLLLRPEDPEAAADALARLVDGLGSFTGAEPDVETVDGVEITVVEVPEVGVVAYAMTDGIVIIGLSADDVRAAIAAHADGSGLSASDAYVRTFEVAGERAGNEAFVDIGAIVALSGMEADLPADARDILGQVGTFGFTAPSRDNEIEFHAVLTIDEARPE